MTVPIEERLKWRERPARSPVMYQTWSNLLFAHWEGDASLLQASLPTGLTLDTWEGRAFVGVTPFFMRRVRPRGLPPLPWISYFLEMNVRTYVHDASGAPGVWFYSLDCNQPIAVWIARMLLGLRYRHAGMQARKSPTGGIDYRSTRRGEKATARFSYGLGPAESSAVPGTLEFFFLERYLLFTVRRNALLRAQVHHCPYPMHQATLAEFCIEDIHPLGEAGNARPAHVIGSAGVNVEVFAPEAAAT
jgi:uncharacterized protein YqjF (DUF2071 family)